MLLIESPFCDTAWENTISWGHTGGPIALHYPTSHVILIECRPWTCQSSKEDWCEVPYGGIFTSFPRTDKSTISHLGMWWLILCHFIGQKIASLKTYHKADNTLSRSTPCLAGLKWSDCRGRTTCRKKRIWSRPFSQTATCVGGIITSTFI